MTENPQSRATVDTDMSAMCAGSLTDLPKGEKDGRWRDQTEHP